MKVTGFLSGVLATLSVLSGAGAAIPAWHHIPPLVVVLFLCSAILGAFAVIVWTER